VNKRLLDWNLSATADISHVDTTVTTANRVTDSAILAAALPAELRPAAALPRP
jgi:hypothetical protein